VGYYYDGATTLYWNDDEDPTGGHTGTPGNPQPHTLPGGLAVGSPWIGFLTNPVGSVYQTTKSLRAGNNSGVNVKQTTFQSTIGEALYFTAGQITTAVPNIPGVRWRIGTVIGTGDGRYGVSGLSIFKAGGCALQGDIQIHGCSIQATSFALIPFDSTAVDNEAVGNRFVLNNSAGAGVATNRAFKTWIRNTHLNVGNQNPINSIFVVDSLGHRISSSGTLWPSLVNSAASATRIVRVEFLAAPSTSPNASQIKSPTNPSSWFIVEPTWITPEFRKYNFAQNALQLSQGLQHFECWGFHTMVANDDTGDPISGVPVKMVDSVGKVQVDTTTDANGDITFGQAFVPLEPVSGNYAIVADVGNWQYPAANDFSFRYRGPFYLQVNTGPLANPNYYPWSMVLDWPYEGTDRKTGQMTSLRIPVRLIPVAGLVSQWTKCEVGPA